MKLTQVHFQKVLASLLHACKCQGKSFKEWQDSDFMDAVTGARGMKGTTVLASLESFCSTMRQLPTNFGTSAHKWLDPSCSPVCEITSKLVKEKLPDIFQELVRQFGSSCLEQQPWWLEEAKDAFMPRKVPPPAFWSRAAAHDVPLSKIQCLEAVSRTFTTSGDVMEDCRAMFNKASLMQSICQVQEFMVQRQMESPSLAHLAELLSKLQKPVQTMVSAFGKLAAHPQKDAFTADIVRYAVDPVSTTALAHLGSEIGKVGNGDEGWCIFSCFMLLLLKFRRLHCNWHSVIQSSSLTHWLLFDSLTHWWLMHLLSCFPTSLWPELYHNFYDSNLLLQDISNHNQIINPQNRIDMTRQDGIDWLINK